MAQTKSNAGINATFHDVGDGVRGAYDEQNQMVYLAIDVSQKRREAAPVSKTGKNKLIGTTAGFAMLGPIRLNLNAVGPLNG